MYQSTVTIGVRSAWLLAVVLSASAGCNKPTQQEPQEMSAEPRAERAKSLEGNRVEVVVVQPSRRNLSLTVPGEVEGFRDAVLAAPMGGYVERVHVKEGDRVKAGQVVASVDRAVHAVRLERAKIDVQSAERELARAKSLGASIPRAEIDAADDRLAVAKAALKELTVNVDRAIIKAPFSGYIARVDTEVGEVASPGSPLMRLVQLKPVNVSVALSDRDVAIAREGGTALVQLDARTGQYEGKITSISRAADLKTRSFEALIEIPNEDEALLPGMIANVTLETAEPATGDDNAEKKGAKATPAKQKGDEAKPAADSQESDETQLIISQDWIVTSPKGVGVFLEQGGKAVWRPVKLGEVVRKQVVVKEGLEAGDTLIVVGHRELVDGDPVLVQRRGTCCVQGRASFSD